MFVRQVFHVSDPQSKSCLIFELNNLMLSFVLIDISSVFQILPNEMNAACAFPILGLVSATVPPFLSIMLPRLALSASDGISSGPAAFSEFNLLIALTISLLVGA